MTTEAETLAHDAPADADEHSPAAGTTGAAETDTESKDTEQDDPNPDPDAGDDAGEGDKDKGDPKDDEDDGPKKESGAQRAKRQRERLRLVEAELAALKSGGAPAKPLEGSALDQAVEAMIGAKPEEKDFAGDYLAYERELTAWSAARRMAIPQVQAQTARAEAGQKAQFQARVDDFQDRQEAARKALPDYDAVLGAANVPIEDHVTLEILESEKGELLAYHLAKNPKTLDRLNGLQGRALVREIAKLETALSLPKARTATAAPAPVTPLKGAGTRPAFDPATASMEDYAAAFRARQARR